MKKLEKDCSQNLKKIDGLLYMAQNWKNLLKSLRERTILLQIQKLILI